MYCNSVVVCGVEMEVYSLNTVIVGTGVAGFNAADSLHSLGMKDIAIVTEGIEIGTSRNTGSDKQTYYKLTLSGETQDSVTEMAKTLFNGGSMHGDIAMVEASLSPRSFYKLVEIGVPFPHNRYGEYIGYKTDHDPRQRATSCGPLTSKLMTQKLEEQVIAKGIKIFDGYTVIGILTAKNKTNEETWSIGLIALNRKQLDKPCMGFTLFNCTNIIYATGGPAGMYLTSVYPESQTGASGIAFEAGVRGINLTESQYGLASTKFRWNLSGTYQQVIPRYISTNQDGSDEKEFLEEYFENPGKMLDDIFLKGYQWPFDPRKTDNYGSSIIDILVYNETQVKGRRVFMDFMNNPSCALNVVEFQQLENSENSENSERLEHKEHLEHLEYLLPLQQQQQQQHLKLKQFKKPEQIKRGEMDFSFLGEEAYKYLKNSGVLFGTPIERLRKMNQPAVDLYKNNGIDLSNEYLEIAVCAQHNNGGLAGNIWWESNIRHFFPVGEVNGTFGVYRPGGSALNSTQTGSLRAAQYISENYSEKPLTIECFSELACSQVTETYERAKRFASSLYSASNAYFPSNVPELRKSFQQRMTKAGAHIRSLERTNTAIKECLKDINELETTTRIGDINQLPNAFVNRDILITQLVYLNAIKEYIEKGGKSRGSYLVRDDKGKLPIPNLPEEFRFSLDNGELMNSTCEIELLREGCQYKCQAYWKPVRPIPCEDNWFENVWNAYMRKEIIK